MCKMQLISLTLTLNLGALKYPDAQVRKPTSIYRKFHSSSTFMFGVRHGSTFELQASENKYATNMKTKL